MTDEAMDFLVVPLFKDSLNLSNFMSTGCANQGALRGSPVWVATRRSFTKAKNCANIFSRPFLAAIDVSFCAR